MRQVVVVGGGIAGLAAARRLAGRAEVTVLEAAARAGGKLAPAALDGLELDGGAESVLARRPEAVELATELGLGERLVHPTEAKPAILVGGSAVPVPPSLQGVPTDPAALAGLLSPAGLARAGQEPSRPAPPLTGDVAIGALVEERFGSEVTDRLLEPLLGGVYAGRSRELSLAAVHPALFAAARSGGPLSVHARALVSANRGPVFAGLAGGVSVLAHALLTDLEAYGVRLRTGATVRRLERAGDRYRLICGPTTAEETVSADAVVLAAPAPPTGRLLGGLLPSAGAYAAVPYASVAVVSTAVRGVELQGSGLLIPPGELPTVKALTHSSVKWTWVGDAAARRFGPGVAIVRFSVGRYGEERLLQVPDGTLVDRTLAEARDLLPGWGAVQLLGAAVSRWGGGLPQYRVGHRELVAALRGELADRPGLAVCGAALDGVGVAACLASAATAADKIIADLGGDLG